MEIFNLTRGNSMGSKRRRSHRDLRPETMTGMRTRVAPSRTFMVGDQGDMVAWAPEGASRVEARAESYTENGQWLVVKTTDGRVLVWPANEVRYAQTPDYEAPTPTAERTPTDPAPIADPLSEDYHYASVEIDAGGSATEEELTSVKTVADMLEVDFTLPDGQPGRPEKWRR